MCYLLAWVCFVVAVSLCLKEMVAFVAFLIAAVLFGFFGMVFEVSKRNSAAKWEALTKTYTGMSPDQLKEVTK